MTDNEAFSGKWVYTRHVTAAVSSEFKAMCYLKSNGPERHYDYKEVNSKILQDLESRQNKEENGQSITNYMYKNEMISFLEINTGDNLLRNIPM